MKQVQHILIIDDDSVFAELLCKSLTTISTCSVTVYSSALELFKEQTQEPSLIFVEYKMTDLNGVSAAKIIRKKWAKSIIILISKSQKIKKINIARYGIDARMTKDIGTEKIALTGLRIYRKSYTLRLLKYILIVSLIVTCVLFVLYY